MTYFCPNCFAEISPEDTVCPACQYPLSAWQQLSYDNKLIVALSHTETNTRMRAVQLLGERKVRAAVPVLQQKFNQSTDPYFQAEIMKALFRIDREAAEEFFQRTLTGKESVVIQHTWKELREKL